MKNLLNIGFINNTRGLKGEIKVTHYCDYKEMFSSVFSVVIENKTYNIEYVKYHKEQVILKLQGVNTINDAEALKSKNIYAKREEMPDLEEGQYYIADLIGFLAYTASNEYIGMVTDVITSTASDLFQIETDEKKTHLVPNIPQFVDSINMEEGKIIITPIEGLL